MIRAIAIDDVAYVRSSIIDMFDQDFKLEGNYTTFYTNQKEKILVSKPMKKVQETLSENIFIRCHQSYIVNKKHVIK